MLNSPKEMFHVSGDKTQGISSTANLGNNALCKPVVLYQSKEMGDLFLTLDVYAMPGAPMYAVIRCPKCQARNPDSEGMDLTIKADQKQMHVDHRALPSYPGYKLEELVGGIEGVTSLNDLRGVISVETFRCAWEETPDLRRGFGFSVCDWKISITNNIARDEK